VVYDLDSREVLRGADEIAQRNKIIRLREPARRFTTEALDRADPSPASPLQHRSDQGLRTRVALGRTNQHQTVTVSETTLAIKLDDGETRIVRRTTTLPGP
jgi:hypothetical protein